DLRMLSETSGDFVVVEHPTRVVTTSSASTLEHSLSVFIFLLEIAAQRAGTRTKRSYFSNIFSTWPTFFWTFPAVFSSWPAASRSGLLVSCPAFSFIRSEEHTSELQSPDHL